MEQKTKSLNIIRTFLIFFIGFLTGFLTFVNLTQNTINNYLPKTSSNIPFLGENLNQSLDYKKIEGVYSLIEQTFYGVDGIEKSKLTDGAIKGMVDALGDKHTNFLTSEENQVFQDSLNGSFEGIGAVISKVDLGIRIERIIKGSPAKKYGLKSGDIILKSNGVDLAPLDQNEGISYIKGPAGTTAILTILREGETDFLIKEVVRDKISIPSVNSETFDNIGYISLNVFGKETDKEFREELDKMAGENVDGIIIDLRDNGGGFLHSAEIILSNFIKKNDVIVKVKHRNFLKNNDLKSLNDGVIFDKPIVILINENSASASEIMAGAMQDYKKAIIVGTKSFGKGSVQEPFELKDGGLVKVTIAKWFTPLDKNIDGEGITPDISVELTKEDYQNTFDRQLEESKKILTELIKTKNIENTISKFLTSN